MASYCFFIAASWGDAAVPNHFKALAARLVERGHRVVYLPHGQQVSIDDGDFHVRSFPSPRPTRLRDFIFLHQLVREYKPDCMIANFGAGNVMTIIGWLNRIPCRVDWYHSSSKAFNIETSTRWKQALLISRKRLIYMLCTHLVAVSEATRDDLISTYRVSSRKSQVFYNNLRDPLKELDSLSSTTPNSIVVCPGNLFPWKGQDILIRAAEIVYRQFPELRIQMIGDGPQKAEYEQLIRDNRLERCCTLIGKLSRLQVLLQVRQASIAVVPSRHDGFPYVVLESMAVGTPVIASAVGGIPEAIRDGVDGFLIPPDDPEALAEKIKMLYSDPALREQMGKNARQRFLDVFEQTRNIEQQVLWFEELVRQARD